MTNQQLINFFNLQKHIFGVCPFEGKIFRLSDCHVHLKGRPKVDWFHKLQNSEIRINKAIERFETIGQHEENRKGRLQAKRISRKLDKIFKPYKLNVEDSIGIFHPVDYIVFNGMCNGKIKNIIFMDSLKISAEEKQLQKSVTRSIENGNYEWVTFRINNDGSLIKDKN